MEKPKTLSQLSEPIAIGRSAEIYPWQPGKVIKLFFAGFSPSEIESEFQNTCEADRRGVCGMRCYEKVPIENRVGIVLDRVEGVSLTRLSEKSLPAFFSLPRKLAELHAGLHGKKSESLKEIRSFAKSMLDLKPLDFLGEEEKGRAGALIDALPGGSAILHMDFHPENVLVQGDSYVIIDWMTAARGNPAADVAYTYFLMHDAELWPGTPKLKLIFYNIVRNYILRGYLKEYRKMTGMTMEEINAWRLSILLLRLGLWDIDSERDRLRTEIRAIISRIG
ncbi:MAG: phosphotransferase [Spirochaetes bacterium]|nr:phosphotransferase [Spirochaetota bacterium]